MVASILYLKNLYILILKYNCKVEIPCELLLYFYLKFILLYFNLYIKILLLKYRSNSHGCSYTLLKIYSMTLFILKYY